MNHAISGVDMTVNITARSATELLSLSLPSALCPLPSALCPLPSALCPCLCLNPSLPLPLSTYTSTSASTSNPASNSASICTSTSTSASGYPPLPHLLLWGAFSSKISSGSAERLVDPRKPQRANLDSSQNLYEEFTRLAETRLA